MSIEKVNFEKVVKEAIPYTLVYTKVIQQISDHLALALWVYLLSLPPEWRINKIQLKKHFNIGDARLKNTLAFLHKSKLIDYVRNRDAQGQLLDCAIHVLCGDKFVNIQQDEECASTGSKTTRMETHTYGNPTPYKRNINTKENNIKNINCASDDAPDPKQNRFEEFWKLYPRKKDKARTMKIWEKKKYDAIADKLLEDVQKRINSDVQWENPEFIPYPSTYLHNERWEDDVTEKGDEKNKSNNNLSQHQASLKRGWDVIKNGSWD